MSCAGGSPGVGGRWGGGAAHSGICSVRCRGDAFGDAVALIGCGGRAARMWREGRGRGWGGGGGTAAARPAAAACYSPCEQPSSGPDPSALKGGGFEREVNKRGWN